MENELTILQALLEVARMIKTATAPARWKTMIISLPAQPYHRQGDPPEAELYSQSDLVESWAALGWEPVCMVAPYELLLKKRLPPDMDQEPYDPVKAYAARKVEEITKAVHDVILPYDTRDLTVGVARESA